MAYRKTKGNGRRPTIGGMHKHTTRKPPKPRDWLVVAERRKEASKSRGETIKNIIAEERHELSS